VLHSSALYSYIAAAAVQLFRSIEDISCTFSFGEKGYKQKEMVPYYYNSLILLLVLILLVNGVPQSSNQLSDCPDSSVAFELLMDFSGLDSIFLSNKSADGALLLQHSVSMSMELCIDACRTNPACYALHYKQNTGLCDLFKDRPTLSFLSPSGRSKFSFFCLKKSKQKTKCNTYNVILFNICYDI